MGHQILMTRTNERPILLTNLIGVIAFLAIFQACSWRTDISSSHESKLHVAASKKSIPVVHFPPNKKAGVVTYIGIKHSDSPASLHFSNNINLYTWRNVEAVRGRNSSWQITTSCKRHYASINPVIQFERRSSSEILKKHMNFQDASFTIDERVLFAINKNIRSQLRNGRSNHHEHGGEEYKVLHPFRLDGGKESKNLVYHCMVVLTALFVGGFIIGVVGFGLSAWAFVGFFDGMSKLLSSALFCLGVVLLLGGAGLISGVQASAWPVCA